MLFIGMWPCAGRHKSFVGIARRRCGKTMGYIIPLLNQLLTNDETLYAGKSKEAPLAVIICPTWKVAVDVYEKLSIAGGKNHYERWF